MLNFLSQVGALALLIAGVALGWRRWHSEGLTFQQRGLLLLLILTAAGGLFGAPFWWMDSPAAFSWDLPPLASRMLAAAGLGFAVVGWFVLEERRASTARWYLIVLAIYLVPLVAAILLLHLDRFDWTAPITYAFFLIAGGMSVAALWHLTLGTELGAPTGGAAPVPAVQGWLWAIAAVMGAWGTALFLWPAGPWPLVFVWPADALTSHLIAVMLLTLAGGALLARGDAGRARHMLALGTIYGFGVTAAAIWNLAAGRPVPAAYAISFAVLAVGSFALLALTQRTAGKLPERG